jgi:hypothetical protein
VCVYTQEAQDVVAGISITTHRYRGHSRRHIIGLDRHLFSSTTPDRPTNRPEDRDCKTEVTPPGRGFLVHCLVYNQRWRSMLHMTTGRTRRERGAMPNPIGSHRVESNMSRSTGISRCAEA